MAINETVINGNNRQEKGIKSLICNKQGIKT